jgi:C-terminal peptidase prc
MLVTALNPHIGYDKAVNEPLQGEFDGIGVVFNMAPDTVIVLNVIPSGPSDKAGVKAGDRIIRINDSLVAGQKIPNNEIVKRLRGKRGTQVKLSLERQGIAEPVEVEVTRGAIPIKSLEAAFMLPDSIGYIKLSQFAITSHNELITALNNLKAQGMKRLIFDLRGNPGGFLDQAIRIANEFLPADKLIVYTEDRNHNRTDEMSDGNGTIQELPLAVLIDEFSASSSEILAGALQDNDRGTIIGRRSFGKGLDKTMTEEANQIVAGLEGLADRRSIVLYNEDWHKGVIGIVASRLTEVYYRPAVVLTRTDDMATGSARSVSGFDVYKAIEYCRDLLENFGGHTYAAGLSMKVENVPEFHRRFEAYVETHILPEQTSAILNIDAQIDFKDITHKFDSLKTATGRSDEYCADKSISLAWGQASNELKQELFGKHLLLLHNLQI